MIQLVLKGEHAFEDYGGSIRRRAWRFALDIIQHYLRGIGAEVVEGDINCTISCDVVFGYQRYITLI